MGDNGKQVSWLAAYGPHITFPDLERPVVSDARHTAYSCGGSPGFTPEFPFNPREGNLSYLLTVPQNEVRVNQVCGASGAASSELEIPHAFEMHSKREPLPSPAWDCDAALTVTVIAGRLTRRSGVRRPRGRWVKREAGENPLGVSPALPPQR